MLRRKEKERVELKMLRQQNANKVFNCLNLGEDPGESLSISRKPKRKAEEDPSFVLPLSKSHRRCDPGPVNIPRDITTRPKVYAASVRRKLGNVGMVDVMTAVLTESGADPADYNLSANHLNTKKKRSMRNAAKLKKESYVPPAFPILAWYGMKRRWRGMAKRKFVWRFPSVEEKNHHSTSAVFVWRMARAQQLERKLLLRVQSGVLGRRGNHLSCRFLTKQLQTQVYFVLKIIRQRCPIVQ